MSLQISNKYISNIKDKNEIICISLVSLLNHYGYTVIQPTVYKGKRGIKDSSKYNVSGRDYAKIAKIINASYNATRKYVELCISNGYITDNNGKLTVSSVRSKHKDHNFCICEDFSNEDYSLMNVVREMRFYNVTNVIRKKLYIKSLLAERENVSNTKELKRIDRKLRKLGIIDKNYHDCGITLKRLTRESGYAKSTVIRYLKYGEYRGKIAIRRNSITSYSSGDRSNTETSTIDNQLLGTYTFGYVNSGITVRVKMFANTYIIPDSKSEMPPGNYFCSMFRNQIYC